MEKIREGMKGERGLRINSNQTPDIEYPSNAQLMIRNA